MKHRFLYFGIGILAIALAAIAVAYAPTAVKIRGLSAQLIGSQTSLYNSCIKNFSSESPRAFIITSAELNDDSKPDAIIQYTKAPQCGTAGCVYELCVSAKDTQDYEFIPLGIAGHSLTVLGTLTNGMHDLEFNNDQHLIMSWNTHSYSLSEN